MTPTYYFFGPSDIEAQNSIERVPVEGGYILNIDLSGNLPILDFVRGDPELSANAHEVLLGLHQIRIPGNMPINLVNLVGDADASAKTLGRIQTIIDKIKPQRVFNAPGDVLTTSRVRLPQTLADIPGCVVARVEETFPADAGQLRTACATFDSWPLVIRARTLHGGKNMLLVNSADDLAAIENTDWLYGGNGLFLMEYLDYGEDGLFQKTRIIMIDSKPLPRHSVFDDRWTVGASARFGLMKKNMKYREREKDYLHWLTGDGLERYGHVFEAIHQRIGLDIFGVDCAIRDDKVYLFEANACMNFLGDSGVGDGEYEYLVPYVAAVREAVRGVLTS